VQAVKKNTNSQRINNPMKKWANEINREFSKKDMQISNKYMKKCSTSLAIKEIQIKMTLIFHLASVKMTIKSVASTYAGDDAKEKETLYTVGRNIN
jgi:hypothetical protein